jgi:IS30 family transposase
MPKAKEPAKKKAPAKKKRLPTKKQIAAEKAADNREKRAQKAQKALEEKRIGANARRAASYDVTPELCQKVEALAAQGLTQAQICHVIGWSQQTLILKKRAYNELSEAIEAGKAKGLAQVSNALYKNAISGDTAAQKYYLNNRAPDEWKDRRENVMTGPNGGNLEISWKS